MGFPHQTLHNGAVMTEERRTSVLCNLNVAHIRSDTCQSLKWTHSKKVGSQHRFSVLLFWTSSKV